MTNQIIQNFLTIQQARDNLTAPEVEDQICLGHIFDYFCMVVLMSDIMPPRSQIICPRSLTVPPINSTIKQDTEITLSSVIDTIESRPSMHSPEISIERLTSTDFNTHLNDEEIIEGITAEDDAIQEVSDVLTGKNIRSVVKRP